MCQRESKMRKAICIGLCVALTGCVTAARQESPTELKARSEQATAACRAEPLTSYVARAQCLNDAAMIAAPTVENPDLFRRALASRLEIAGRVDNKEITPAEGAQQYAKVEAQLAAEGKRRLANAQ
jgi:hypothetical protein